MLDFIFINVIHAALFIPLKIYYNYVTAIKESLYQGQLSDWMGGIGPNRYGVNHSKCSTRELHSQLSQISAQWWVDSTLQHCLAWCLHQS